MPRFIDDADDDLPSCPLCAEPLDATELVLRLCSPCGYRICLFCFKRLGEAAESDGRPCASCPNCRSPYDADRIAGAVPDPVA